MERAHKHFFQPPSEQSPKGKPNWPEIIEQIKDNPKDLDLIMELMTNAERKQYFPEHVEPKKTGISRRNQPKS